MNYKQRALPSIDMPVPCIVLYLCTLFKFGVVGGLVTAELDAPASRKLLLPSPTFVHSVDIAGGSFLLGVYIESTRLPLDLD